MDFLQEVKEAQTIIVFYYFLTPKKNPTQTHSRGSYFCSISCTNIDHFSSHVIPLLLPYIEELYLITHEPLMSQI